MKNIQDVLREKEAEIEKLNREIKLLRVAARMLEDDGQSDSGLPLATPMPRQADVAAASPEEPVLEVLPAGSNGDVSKRWP